VKPSNVLFDDDGVAALADFGLARGADSTQLTRDGQLVGTLQYVAPELIEGEEATRASDILCAGCVLYECLAGEPPFTGRSPAELGFAHLFEPPPDPRERRPDLPAALTLGLLTASRRIRPGARRAELRLHGCSTLHAALRRRDPLLDVTPGSPGVRCAARGEGTANALRHLPRLSSA